MLVVIALLSQVGCEPNAVTAPTAVTERFALAGSVFDTAGQPLAHARLEVLNGPQKGAGAFTDDGGAFVFEQIFTAPFTLRASKEGHRDHTKEIANAQSDLIFKLEWDLRGDYTITFAAGAICEGIPASARTRTYMASFESTSANYYLATLGGADFARSSPPSYPDYNVLYADIVDDIARIFFSDPEIWEHLTVETDRSPQTDLRIIGSATGPIGANTSQWSFGGIFVYCPAAEPENYPECKVPEIRCQSQNNQVTLARR